MEVRRYGPELAQDWAAVLSRARNGVFLFDRGFMGYHGTRFEDSSAIAYADGEPAAILPAALNPDRSSATSHAGLTFGGVVLRSDLRGDAAVGAVFDLLDALRSWGITHLTVKLLPQIFTRYPSAEVDYALWRRGFSLVRRDLSSVIPLRRRQGPNRSKMQAVQKARKAGVSVEPGSLPAYHSLLCEVLQAQHGVSPVHSLPELQELMGRFPDNILLRSAHLGGELLAGALIFRYGHVWHTQYLASSVHGRSLGALDLVIESVIAEAAQNEARYLSFGASTEEGGTVLNAGLLWQKESFGARSVVHDFMGGAL